jgi:hypothetical protein
MKPEFLTIEDLLRIHEIELARFGGMTGGAAEEIRSHSLGPTPQVGKHTLSRSPVSAFGRDLHDDTIAVAIAGNVGHRLTSDAIGPVFSRSQG